MVQRFKDDAGRQYEIESIWEKDGKCLVPGEFDSQSDAEQAAHQFAKNNGSE